MPYMQWIWGNEYNSLNAMPIDYREYHPKWTLHQTTSNKPMIMSMDTSIITKTFFKWEQPLEFEYPKVKTPGRFRKGKKSYLKKTGHSGKQIRAAMRYATFLRVKYPWRERPFSWVHFQKLKAAYDKAGKVAKVGERIEDDKVENSHEPIECLSCWGSGWETQFVKPCPICNGTGRI